MQNTSRLIYLATVQAVSTSDLSQGRKGGNVPRFRHFILTQNRLRWSGMIAMVAAAAWLASMVWAADESKTGQTENEPIQIVADKLVSYNQDKYAEFIGNVMVTQGNLTITSDKLRIHYQGDLLESENKSSDEDLLKKIIATGNVKISSDQYNAEADTAEYDTTAKTVVLRGENAKVISGKNSITGSIITLNQKSGQVKVEGSGSKRIKAKFFTKDKASEAFKLEKSEEKSTN